MTVRPRRLVVAVLLVGLAAGLLTACGGSSPEATPTGGPSIAATGPADAQTVMIDSTDRLTYAPSVITARVGTLTISLGNSGQIPHNLVFDDESLPSIGTVTGGKELSATYTFTEPGTYAFVCTFHNGMDGTVVVS